jgi:hypothetical protein
VVVYRPLAVRGRRGCAALIRVPGRRRNLTVHVSKHGDAHHGVLLVCFHRARIAGVERSSGARQHRSAS